MTEISVKPEVKGDSKPHRMILSPEEGSRIEIYSADFGSGLSVAQGEITSEIEFTYSVPPIFERIRGEPHHNVGSFHGEVTKSPKQPELKGKRGWIHLHTIKINGKWVNIWGSVQVAR